MKNLQEATERICELKGSQVAMDALLPAVLEALTTPALARLAVAFDAHAEAARTAMLHADISDISLAAFERDVARHRALLQGSLAPGSTGRPAGVDALLLTTTRVTAYAAARPLGSASGFFYRHGEQRFLVSHRQVLAPSEGEQRPDRLEIDVHTDAQDLRRHRIVSLPLYREGRPLWREAADAGGAVDIAALALRAGALPDEAVFEAFDASHLASGTESIAVGDALTIASFPTEGHDTVHHLAVACSAAIASAYGVRFQGQGRFLIDACARRGSSGAPVVRRRGHAHAAGALAGWQLLGVQAPGLDSACYADVLPALTG